MPKIKEKLPGSPSAMKFDCKMCGHCCEGKGGIIVSLRDRERLSAHLDLSEDEFIARFCKSGSGASPKLSIRCGDDGRCIFFRNGQGCAVHAAKPAICRAWPYFRGNLVDAESLELAKDFCPGILEKQEHRDFVKEGVWYLLHEGLTGTGGEDEAAALQIADLLDSLASEDGRS